MRLHATKRTRILPALALLTALTGSRAQAQDPTWDHYKVYQVAPHPSHLEQLTLIDQFGVWTPQSQFLNFFANPVQKTHGTITYPINRPELHYAWWVIATTQPFTRDVIATNQFGDQLIHVGNPAYLLNPALKNAPVGSPLPVANHYLCYECSGNGVNVPVTLVDQFFGRNATVFFPRYFCTPVEKRTSSGGVFPMRDPRQHYVVYDIDPMPNTFAVTIFDQFLIPNAQVSMSNDRFLMVPTLKSFPVPSEPSTWGRMKALFR